MMARLKHIELILIVISGGVAFAVSPLLPTMLAAGHMLLLMSALLLLQSLIRDIALLIKNRHDAAVANGANQKKMRCMCLESTIGITGILAGAGVLGFGINPSIPMSQWSWVVAVLLILALGFAIKDLILQTAPWRIVRDKDHLNIVVSWKK